MLPMKFFVLYILANDNDASMKLLKTHVQRGTNKRKNGSFVGQGRTLLRNDYSNHSFKKEDWGEGV
jgi:hypothetical protein